MATIRVILGGIKDHLATYLPEEEIHRLAQRIGYRFRNRCLRPAESVYLLCLQILAQVALEALRHVAHVQVTAQAICKARQHLPLELLKTLVEAVAERLKGIQGKIPPENVSGNRLCGADPVLGNPTQPQERFKGHRIILTEACFKRLPENLIAWSDRLIRSKEKALGPRKPG